MTGRRRVNEDTALAGMSCLMVLFIMLFNIVWIGVLIWAIIKLVNHFAG